MGVKQMRTRHVVITGTHPVGNKLQIPIKLKGAIRTICPDTSNVGRILPRRRSSSPTFGNGKEDVSRSGLVDSVGWIWRRNSRSVPRLITK
jgi:hypothetical protein